MCLGNIVHFDVKTGVVLTYLVLTLLEAGYDILKVQSVLETG